MPIRTLQIEGMHCEGCETIVETAVSRLPGVLEVKADHHTGHLRVAFEAGREDQAAVTAAVEKEGYRCVMVPRQRNLSRFLGRLLFVVLALAVIGVLLVAGEGLAQRFHLPRLGEGMGYGLLFLVGLFTGFHCVGMCGGFVVGYTARSARAGRRPAVSPHLIYGFAKTLSYTVIGGLFGLLGSAIAFTPALRGYTAVGAGIFLVLFGINMLDWFPVLHRVGLHMPKALRRFLGRESRKSHGPFEVGLLNGLMIACGPLQAMYVMAAGTGDFVEGAKLLLVFGLGTLPVMLSFGFLATVVSGRITHGILRASALLVITLGLLMVNRGLTLAGTGYDFHSLANRGEAALHRLGADAAAWPPLREVAARWEPLGQLLAEWEQPAGVAAMPETPAIQIVRMQVYSGFYKPNRFVLRQGVPVRWIIEVRELVECNRHLLVPALGLDVELRPGENVVEFTPTKAGALPFSCWMGMLRGNFEVEPAVPRPAE